VPFDVSGEPHSAAFFNPQRDFWWNDDYLELLGRRFGLSTVQTVLDVGAGVGHWGALLLPLLAPEATITGVERDPRWVADATRRASELSIDDRCSYLEGVAEALPFQDGSFDLVTCQTLLIHVPDVAAVVGEMLRVLRPGGLLLVAEPNNLAGQLIANSATADQTVEELVERFEFALIYERGKTALGEGNSSVGDLLPGYFARAGLKDVQTFLNDKTFELVPPYSTPAQQALHGAIVADADVQSWSGLTEAETRRCYLAGGGNEETFADRWQRRLDEARSIVRGLSSDSLDTAGGGIQYVVAGRRPA
jgi:ubiquinone/menaquinone biosynthesis C-methylase UbiE